MVKKVQKTLLKYAKREKKIILLHSSVLVITMKSFYLTATIFLFRLKKFLIILLRKS